MICDIHDLSFISSVLSTVSIKNLNRVFSEPFLLNYIVLFLYIFNCVVSLYQKKIHIGKQNTTSSFDVYYFKINGIYYNMGNHKYR